MASGFDLVPLTPQKTDPAWKHCQMFKNGNRVHLKCLYCDKVLKGGGIHRIKEHLAGHKGNASTCLKVPQSVQLLMQQSLDGAVTRRRKKQKIDEVIVNIQPPSNDNIDTLVTQGGGSGGISSNIELLPLDFDSSEHHQPPVVSHDGRIDKNKVRRKKPRDKAPLQTPEVKDEMYLTNVSLRNINNLHIAIGRFLYDIGAPMSAVNSIYFQPMIDAVASIGSGVVVPTYHDLRGPVLKKVVEEVKGDIARYASTWESTGCSLIVEQWNTEKGRAFLGFTVHCPEGTVSLKSVDASQYIDSSDDLLQVLMEVLEEVGVKNVLQVITSDEEHFVDAGKRLMDNFPNLYWSPCSAQCIDLILKDFGEIDWIRSILDQAHSITRFIYNHAAVLNLLRKYTCGVDIVEPGRSCFATNFMTLRRMVDKANNLKSMVSSMEWKNSPYSQEGLEMVEYVQSEEFWSSCTRITRLTSPLLRLLRIVTSEKKAAIGYVYAGIYRAKEAIKTELLGGEMMNYKEYWKIIDQRWRRYSSLPLHAAAFFLNPKFFYSIKGDLPSEVVSGIVDCIERLVRDLKVQDMVMREISSYKSGDGDFGRKMAIRARDHMLPADWWSTYGGGCPNLSRLAIRILGQTCSSLDVVSKSQTASSFDQISDMRNALEHQRLSDLVFVQHNFRLRANKIKKQDSTDPTASEVREVVEDWVMMGKDTEKKVFDDPDWATVGPPYGASLGPFVDETEGLGTGFDDDEILNREKDTELDNNNNNNNNAGKE